jgi:very-short-patch-repair endonuclease
MQADRALSELAAGQHSLFTRRQALDAGLTRRQLERRVDDGKLLRPQRTVYAFASAPVTFEQSVLAACLATGGVASHRTAAALWDLRGLERPVVEITVTAAQAPQLPEVVVHRTTSLDRRDIGRRRDVPVTAPGRTLLDLAAVAPALVEAALDDALIRGLVSVSWLERFLDRAGRRGRPGTGVLRRLVEERAEGQASTESHLEDELIQLLRRHDLPVPVRRHVITVGGVVIRLDLAYPVVKLALEADGRRWHSSRADFQRDRTRGNLLAAQGWTVLRFTADDIRNRSSKVATEIAGLLRTLQSQAG